MALSSVALNWMFAKAAQNDLPLDSEIVKKNRDRVEADAAITPRDPTGRKFRVVRWNDQTHSSVTFRKDTAKRKHNNPPEGIERVSDSGKVVGKFKVG